MNQQSIQEKKENILKDIQLKLLNRFGKSMGEANKAQLYLACSLVIREEIMAKWLETRRSEAAQNGKKLYYLSVEFLPGRAFSNNLLNLDETEIYREVLSDLGLSINELEDMEADPGWATAAWAAWRAASSIPSPRWTIRPWAAASAMSTASSASASSTTPKWKRPTPGSTIWAGIPGRSACPRTRWRSILAAVWRSAGRRTTSTSVMWTTPWSTRCPMTCPSWATRRTTWVP